MNASPIRSLLFRRFCTCPGLRTAQHGPSTRALRNASRRSASSYTNPPPTYGSSELLKRQYQPKPKSTQAISAERAKIYRRMKYSAIGIFLCTLGLFSTAYAYPLPRKNNKAEKTPPSNSTSLDAPPPIVGINLDQSPHDEVEHVPTGTSTIPTFPKTIFLSSLNPPSNAAVVDTGEQEYHLVGLGIRTVSFLSIQVYVVGLYIALADIATLQERLIRTLDPVATTLVPAERAKLKELLLDPERGEEVWNAILKDGAIRTALRIVPTRNTDFMHLRDGWVRGITARTQNLSAKGDASFSDEAFGQSVNEFKAIWGGGARKNVPKGETLLLTRDAQGKLGAWYEDKKGYSFKLGGIVDERISRLIWLGYLGGKTVSSEGARQSVVQGVMEYVERPVGTVASQVV